MGKTRQGTNLMARGGMRDGAGRKPKVSPKQAQLISDNCDALFWMVWMERYYRITEKAMPRLLDRNRLETMQPLNVSAEEMELALGASDDELDGVLGGNRAEVWRDHVADAEYNLKIDIGLLPKNIGAMPDDIASPLMETEWERGAICWTFTPSIQSIEAEVKQRAQRALANVGIEISEKTIGHIWKRNYRLPD